MLIRNARVLDPESKRDEICDIRIREGRIREIGKGLPQDGDEVMEAMGLAAAPGLIDVHSHFRDPGQTEKEDILTGAAAAAAGGYTTVVLMANTVPSVSTREVLSYVQEKAKGAAIQVLQCSTLTKGMAGSELVDMEEMMESGALGFTDDGKPVMDTAVLLEGMRRAKALDAVISLHEEDPALVYKAGVNRGRVSEALGFPGAARGAEDVMVARDIMLALETGARIDIQHISSKNAVEMVRLGKKLGADVWAEATPHHFSLTEEAVLTKGAMAKMNPPLREESDRQAIIEGLKDGTIEIIATDHAPHTKEEKEKGLFGAPSGIIGLETALALGITNLVRPGHLSLLKLIEKMTLKPADLYRLDAGRLRVGGPADLVIFDPEARWTPSEATFCSKSCNSPFIGEELCGKVLCTLFHGKVIYRG